MKVLTTGVIRPKSHEERVAAQDVEDVRTIAALLGLETNWVAVRYGVTRINAAVLIEALRRIHAQAEAKTAEQLMFEADVLDEYDDQPGARTLFPSDCAGE